MATTRKSTAKTATPAKPRARKGPATAKSRMRTESQSEVKTEEQVKLPAPPRPQVPAYPELNALDEQKARALCEHFSAEAKAHNALVCFLLDFLPADVSAGLELSAFRRAEMLREYCGVEPWLLINYYQPHLVEIGLQQLRLGRLHVAHLANLYDFVQGINRSSTPKKKAELVLNASWRSMAVKDTRDHLVYDGYGKQLLYVHRNAEDSLDYVNYIKDGKIVRRDTYDPLGFLSRTEFVTPENGQTHTALFYRQDRTLALMETYRAPVSAGARPITDTINILDKNGFTVQRFCYRDEMIAWWLLQLLGNKQTTYLCVADQLMDYQRYFVEIKKQQASYPNIRVAAVSHNCHAVDPLDVMNSTLGDNYRFLCDQNQRIDRVVTLTAWQKADVQARFGAQAHPITVIPHATSYTEEEIEAPRDEANRLPPHSIALVGRFAPAKNQLQALELIKKVRASVTDATLHFYGSGEQEKEVREQAEKQGLTEFVHFHGFIPDLKPMYKSADILLSMSEHEGLPLNIIEALSLGCPVVAFACRYGPSELITDGVDGYLVESGDLEGAAERCIRLLSDPKLLSEFKAQARGFSQKFSTLKVAALWAQLLTELLG